MAEASERSRRTRVVTEDAVGEERSDFERDRDRVLYSSSFLRLAGVTQVASVSEVALLHNRLTHSLKVAQVGRKAAATIREAGRADEAVAKALWKFGGANPSDAREGGDGLHHHVDGWVLETAGMVHDLGHPPFGHIAEVELQRILSDNPNAGSSGSGSPLEVSPKIPTGYHLPDSFEGNAQSFRIIARLSFGRYGVGPDKRGGVGLNLTRASLSAMMKYPWQKNNRPEGVNAIKMKWGSYDSERLILDYCMGSINVDPRERFAEHNEYRSIEAQIMDWADDITYAVHDLEDFHKAGLIPIEQLTGTESVIKENFRLYCLAKLEADPLVQDAVANAKLSIEDIFEETLTGRGHTPSLLSSLPGILAGRGHREAMRGWAQERIDYWTGSGCLTIDPQLGLLLIDTKSMVQVEILKNLTWHFVIERPGLGAAQQGQRRLIRELFVWLASWAESRYEPPRKSDYKSGHQPGKDIPPPRKDYTSGGLPPKLVDFLDVSFCTPAWLSGYADDPKKNIARGVTDYIGSLTEAQALELHQRLSGSSPNSMLDDWFTV